MMKGFKLRTVFILAALIIGFSPYIHAELSKNPEPFKLIGIDVYGTNQKNSDLILHKYGQKLYAFTIASVLDPKNPTQMIDEKSAKELHDKIKADLLADGQYSFVNLSEVFYYEPNRYSVTIDVVEKKDQLSRNTFNPKPTQTFSDPGQLIDKWQQYEAKGFELLQTNQISSVSNPCIDPVCLFGFKHPELKPYKTIFASISKYEQNIIQILNNDQDPKKRAAAAFLIGYLDNPKKSVELLMPALKDDDSGVRNNAMRVIAGIKLQHPEIKVNLKEFLDNLNGPTTTDRNKALFVLLQYTDAPEFAELFQNKKTKWILVNLLKLRQPNNHEMAYMILKKISHQNYAEYDIQSWANWAAS